LAQAGPVGILALKGGHLYLMLPVLEQVLAVLSQPVAVMEEHTGEQEPTVVLAAVVVRRQLQ
jgi:hypothetical protein